MSIRCIVMPMLIPFIVVLILLLLKPAVVSESVLESAQLWFFSLIPVLYPSLILMEFIQNEPWTKAICHFFFPFAKKIFHITSPDSLLVIIVSILCGAPASTKMIENLKDNQMLSLQEANSLTYAFSSISFFYLLSVFTKNGYSFALYIPLVLLTSFFIMWICNKNNEAIEENTYTKKPYLPIFFESIEKTTKIVINILGIIMVFRILVSLFSLQNSLIYPFIEILGGQSVFSKIKAPKSLLTMLSISSLTFLGVSIHFQILFINPKLNYIKFLVIKLLQSFIVGFLFVLISEL